VRAVDLGVVVDAEDIDGAGNLVVPVDDPVAAAKCSVSVGRLGSASAVAAAGAVTEETR
jgi:hypothetical protein